MEEKTNVTKVSKTGSNSCKTSDKLQNTCGFGLFTCSDESCIPQTYICDGNNDCPCAEDEKSCKCDVSDLLRMAFACFKNLDLPELTIKSFSSNSTETIQCTIGSSPKYVIPKTKWCIYEKSSWRRTARYCPHGEHLKNCKNHFCKYFKCPNTYCVPYSYLCDGTWDCPRGQDEKHSVCLSCAGAFRCRNQKQCVPIIIVCDGEVQCPIGDDELLCTYENITCPSGCTCMLHTIMCTKTDISSIINFNVKYQNKLHVLYATGKDLDIHHLTFKNLNNLLYLNISNSNISNICFEQSIFITLKRLLILDLRENSISSLRKQCITGPSFLQNLSLDINLLTYIETNSFFNILNVSNLKLNNMKIEQIGHNFFSSQKENMLKHLDISNNLLTFISSGIFSSLNNLKVLLVYGNNLNQLLFKVPDQIYLHYFYVDHALQCKFISTEHCVVFSKSKCSSLYFSFFIPEFNTIFLILFVLIILFNILIIIVGIFAKIFPKDYIILIMFVNDLLLTFSWCCLVALIYSNSQYSFKPYVLCYCIGLITLASFLIDLFLKTLDSFSVYLITKSKIPWIKIMPKLVIFLMMLSGLVSVVTIEFSSLKIQLDFNSKILESIMYAIPFALPTPSTHIFSICSITLFLIWFNLITIMSINNIIKQSAAMKQMSSNTSVPNRNVLVKRLFGNLVVKNISLVAILASSIAMLFTSSFALSVFMLISIWCKLLINSIMFVVLNRTFRKTVVKLLCYKFL